MVSANTSVDGSEAFKKDMRAFKRSFEITRDYPGLGLQVTRQIDQRDSRVKRPLDLSDAFPDDLLDQLPDEVREIVAFVEENWVAIANQNTGKLDELLDRAAQLYKRFEEEVDADIWILLEDGVEAETLEYLHSLLTKSAREIRLLMENKSVKAVESPRTGEKFVKRINALLIGMDRLFYAIKNESISQSEKREIDKIVAELDEDYIGVREGEEVTEERISKPLIG